MTPEGKVKAAIKRLLQKEDIYFFFPVQSPLGAHGIPDLICCRPLVITQEMVGQTIGQFLAIETKAPGKKWNTSPNQKRNLQAIADHHGLAVVADCVEDVTEALNVRLP